MKKILNAIKLFFLSVFASAKKFEQFLIDHVDDAILIVSKVKEAVDSPIIHTIFFFLPEKYKTVGGEALKKVEVIIDKVLAEMLLSEECLKKATVSERLKCFIQQIKRLSPAMQEAAFHKFAALYTKHSSGEKLPGSYFDTAVQDRFFTLKQNIAV